ncbi:TetR/AcrR family transcriptional regulator [Nocardia otitidiscaviarum]|uniref:TetR/AcrR family transcriptional regulator n=1 Tax=Nocardia otitidiscaviarum TaxID=1823 RepID=UPI0018943C79|nr:TetR/AcrR family transcriptional regulator [Nocardia otitidiscaviarum]MBF6181006.1 TetR/AcrR family transcriptional regulator [Nocardia otitidiscaviarum]
MARTQRADLHERADAILDAATELMLTTAARDLRIEEVARRAGVGKGTVYLHWASREELMLAVGAREAAAMLATVIAAMRAEPVEVALHRYLRRHFLEAMRRPILHSLFVTDHTRLGALADHPARTRLAEAKLRAAHDHLAALREHRLLRPGLHPVDVDFSAQAVAYGFFAATPLLSGDARFTLDHRADQLADVIRRSFEPARPPAPERYAAAAPRVVDAFERLRNEFRRTAYGAAAD